MKLKDLMAVIQCNTYIELYSRDAKLISTFKRRDHAEYGSEISEYLDCYVYMISADSGVIEIVII